MKEVSCSSGGDREFLVSEPGITHELILPLTTIMRRTGQEVDQVRYQKLPCRTARDQRLEHPSARLQVTWMDLLLSYQVETCLVFGTHGSVCLC